jgi:hypothetical protein
MTDFPVTLNLPQHLYDRARELAQQKNMALEQVLLHQLESSMLDLPPLPPDEQDELDALNLLTTDTLRTIALAEMADDQAQRMQVLMEENNLGTISAEARGELAQLVEQGQRLMLRKAAAAALLAERGNPIAPADAADE